MRAADVAKALNGRPNGDGYLVSCPLPGHGKGNGDRNPSLSIRDGDQVDLILRCHGGCDSRDVLAELRRRGLVADREPYPDRPPALRRPTPPRPEAIEPDARALALWRAASAGGALVAAYLAGREITLPAPPTLRQGRTLVLGDVALPTMVAAVQAPDRRVVAVQETRLTWGGRKSPMRNPRKTTGAIAGSAVRLGPAGDVLGLAEGIETGLSAMQMSAVPVWCSLGAENLPNLIIPDTVRELIIFADADDPGQRAATKTAKRWSERGVSVSIRTPIEVNDWNDVLRRQSAMAA